MNSYVPIVYSSNNSFDTDKTVGSPSYLSHKTDTKRNFEQSDTRSLQTDDLGGCWFLDTTTDFNEGTPNKVSINGSGNAARIGLAFNGNDNWVQKNPGNSPSARWVRAMDYDIHNNRVVLFGGYGGSYKDDTWVYDLVNNTWSNMNPNPHPTSRYGHAMVYDSINQKFVLFGGWNPPNNLYDTWTYDLGTNTWTQKNPSPHPQGRRFHAMTFDRANGKVVLFGGELAGAGNGEKLEDTWTYDVNTNTWSRKYPSPHPPKRGYHDIVYENERNRVILFSGIGGDNGNTLEDTWAYDLANNVWSRLHPSPHPCGRWNYKMEYDPAHNKILLFGGYNNTDLDDTWTYDLGTDSWGERLLLRHPLLRRCCSLAYDRINNRAVLFGGYDENNGMYGDTWIYTPQGFETEGIYVSSVINLPPDCRWDTAAVNKHETRGNGITATLYNGTTDIPIEGYENRTERNLDLNELNDIGVTSLKMKVFFHGNGSSTPTLDSLGVEWVKENAWRDSFIGDGKLDRRLEADEHTVALWHFDDGNGNVLVDSSGNGNNGAITGAMWCDGRMGGGLDFDGVSDYVKVSESNMNGALDLNSFTIELWISPRMTSSHQVIVCKRDQSDTESNYLLSLRKKSGHYYPQMLFGSGSEWFTATSGKPIKLNKWSHITGTYDGSILRIYQNGEFQTEVDCSSNPVPYRSNADVFIGAYSIEDSPWLNDFLFDGIIDEVRISNIARSPEEIRRSALMGLNISGGQVQLPGNALLLEPGMIGLWKFDEGNGNMVYDRSGNGNNGTLHNMDDNDWVNGRTGKALAFDGVNDYVALPEADNIMGITRDFTIFGYFIPRDFPAASYLIDLNYINVNVDKGNGLTVFFGADRKLFCFVYLADDANGQQYRLTSNTLLTIGNQFCFTIKRENAIMEMYINGRLESSVITSSNDVFFSYNHPSHIDDYNSFGIIQHQSGTLYSPFKGILDDIVIYGHAITTRDICLLSNLYYPNATLRSENITLPKNMTWDSFHVNRSVPDNSFLNVSIHDAVTDETLIQNTNNTSELNLILKSINSVEHDTIYLRAHVQSSQTRTPSLYDWGVNWTLRPSNIVAPELLENIPSVLSIVEDTPIENIIDLSEYFSDIYSSFSPPTYGLEYVSDTLNLTLNLDGPEIDVPHLVENWTGNISVIANCTNMYGLSTSTDTFVIRVVNVNDLPFWKSLPPMITMDEDEDETYITDHSLDEYVYDCDSDEIFFSISSSNDNISVSLTDDNRILVIPTANYFGDMDITAKAWDLNKTNSSSTVIPIVIRPVNDPPFVELISPANGSLINDVNVTLSWEGIDIDNDVSGLLYFLYLGEKASPIFYRSDIISDNFALSDLKDDTTYYWYVIPYDGTDYGQCLNRTWSFTVNTTVPIPEVTLLSPRDGDEFNSTTVELTWGIHNPTGEEILCQILLGNSKEDMEEIISTRDSFFVLTDLEKNSTYYWSIIPYISEVKGKCRSGIWSFTVNPSFKGIYELYVNVDVDSLELAQGDFISFNIELRNEGNIQFTVELQAKGDLTEYIDLINSIKVYPEETRIIPAVLSLDLEVNVSDYSLIIEIKYPGGLKEIPIPVTVKSAPPPDNNGNTDAPLLNSPLFWVATLTILIILIVGCVSIFFYYRKLHRIKSAKTDDSGVIPVEIEHIPEGGFSKESEIDLIARNIAVPMNGIPIVQATPIPPSMYQGLLSPPIPPDSIRYTLPGVVQTSPQLPITGETKEVKALPQVSMVISSTQEKTKEEKAPEIMTFSELLPPPAVPPQIPSLPPRGPAPLPAIETLPISPLPPTIDTMPIPTTISQTESAVVAPPIPHQLDGSVIPAGSPKPLEKSLPVEDVKTPVQTTPTSTSTPPIPSLVSELFPEVVKSPVEPPLPPPPHN